MIRRLDARTLGVGGVVRALERSPGSVDPDIHRRVAEIVAAVREKGDAALLELTERFDRVSLSAAELAVDAGEYRAAERQVIEATVRALRYAAERI
jgi:histidinol dehydrogenase